MWYKISEKYTDKIWKDWVVSTSAIARYMGVYIDPVSVQTISKQFAVVREFERWCSCRGMRLVTLEDSKHLITKSSKKIVLMELKYG